MAHEVETMMYVGKTPWHGLGVALPNAPSIEEAIVAAGLDWEVKLIPLVVQGTETIVDSKASVRSSDGKVLGVVGARYHVLQNKDAFGFFQPFLDAGEATLETAMSLCGGSRIAVLAKIKRDPMEIVKGDIVEKYILLSHSHDGSLVVRAGFTPIRVVCNNTLQMSHSSGASSLIRLKHTKSLAASLEMVRETMNTANQAFEATAEQYRLLARRDINKADLEKYVKTVFEIADDKTDNRMVDRIIPLFENGKGNALPGVRGTAWAAYNAVTEYLGYFRGNDQDVRVDSNLFGVAANMNRKALETALKMVA